MAEVKLKWNNLVPLDNQTIQAIGDNIAGVFRLSYTNDGGKNYYVFFVGKSENIKTELLAYLNPGNSNNCISNHISSYECRFRYAETADPTVRIAAERQLYKFYQPTCNKPIPSVDENIIVNMT